MSRQGSSFLQSSYVIIAGALLQIVGYALLTDTEISSSIRRGVFGYQVIAGLGSAVWWL